MPRMRLTPPQVTRSSGFDRAVCAVAANALDREILDRTQKLGLGRQREVRYFVEKERSAVRVSDSAYPHVETPN
jgi:hypothetical protein